MEMENEVNKAVDEVRAFFRKNRATKHPILNHPIGNCEEHMREMYFDMMCVIAQYENEDIENQNRFIVRVMSGCSDITPITEHIKNAVSVTPEIMEDFIKQCDHNGLKEIFFIDALIISCGNGSPNKKQVEFLAEIADVFGYKREEVSFLSKLALSVLEQDFDKLRQSVKESEIDTQYMLKAAECYTLPIIEKNIICDDKRLHYYSLALTNTPLFEEDDSSNDSILISHRDEVIIENQFINKTKIKFYCVNNVRFIGSKFVRSALHFDGVEKIEIENCTFFDYIGEVFDFPGKCDVNIANSLFRNTKKGIVKSWSVHLGGKNGENNITFDSCRFENIFSSYLSGYDGVAISRGNNASAKNCVFLRCKGSHLFDQNGTGVMENNQYINSVDVII